MMSNYLDIARKVLKDQKEETPSLTTPAGTLNLLCNGCRRGVLQLHNLGGGIWRCLSCLELRPLVKGTDHL